jgi:carboxyl-terminal processing protease
MNKLLIILFFFTFTSFQGQITEIQKLESLCKVWGFLKYYHPEVASGNYNWDEEFLKMLPKTQQALSIEELSTVYLEWIESKGEMKPCNKCSQDFGLKYYDKNFDLSWIHDGNYFTKQLSEKLKYIENNRFQGKHYYLDQWKSSSIKVINEPEYSNFDYPDENYRLLSLFKYWNIIEYFFPYKYMADQDWNEVLSEMIPKFQNAQNVTEYHLAMLELVAKIDDTHAYLVSEYIDTYFGEKWPPFAHRIIDEEAIITGFYSDSIAQLNNLKIGDRIIEVNDQPISLVIDKVLKYIPASNKTAKLRYTYNRLFNSNFDSIKVKIKRENIEVYQSIATYPFSVFNYERPEGMKWKILDGNIGYVNTAYISGTDNVRAVRELRNCKAIIFDFRQGTTATLGIANQLVSSEKEFAKILKPDLSYPGNFYWEAATVSGRRNNFKGKIIILVNDGTLSQAEYVAMSIQAAENVTTIGSQTLAADGNVSQFEFIGGFKTAMSGIGIYYPDGSPAQRKGVKVDIEVHPSIQGIKAGRDEVLEAAIEFIVKEVD